MCAHILSVGFSRPTERGGPQRDHKEVLRVKYHGEDKKCPRIPKTRKASFPARLHWAGFIEDVALLSKPGEGQGWGTRASGKAGGLGPCESQGQGQPDPRREWGGPPGRLEHTPLTGASRGAETRNPSQRDRWLPRELCGQQATTEGFWKRAHQICTSGEISKLFALCREVTVRQVNKEAGKTSWAASRNSVD